MHVSCLVRVVNFHFVEKSAGWSHSQFTRVFSCFVPPKTKSQSVAFTLYSLCLNKIRTCSDRGGNTFVVARWISPDHAAAATNSGHFIATHRQVSHWHVRFTHPCGALLLVFYRIYFRETQMRTLKRNCADCVCRLFVPRVHACQKGERLIPLPRLLRFQKLSATMGRAGI